MKIYRCDRCGAEFVPRAKTKEIQVLIAVANYSKLVEKDLCGTCIASLQKWFKF